MTEGSIPETGSPAVLRIGRSAAPISVAGVGAATGIHHALLSLGRYRYVMRLVVPLSSATD